MYVSGMIADVGMCVQMRVRLAYARCNVPTLSDLGAVRLNAVVVNPEAKRHVAIEQQVGNGTA